MSSGLGGSRKRNSFSLKAKLKSRSQHARRVLNDLRGIEKRRSDLRATLPEVSAVVAAAIGHAHAQMPVTPKDVAGGRPITKERAAQLEKMMRKSTASLALFTQKVTLLTEAVSREDATLRAAQKEMKDARKTVKTFMDDTLRVVNDIAHDVTEARIDFADDLREDKAQHLDNPYLISSLMRTRTRTLNATAVGIYPRRRGGAVRKPKAAETPLAVKGSAKAAKT